MHAALELAMASALMALPFALGLSLDATITAAILGVALFGLAVSATETEGRGTLPLSAHAAYDSAIALVLIAAAIAFGLVGEVLAVVVLLAAGMAQLLLSSVTHYSPVRH